MKKLFLAILFCCFNYAVIAQSSLGGGGTPIGNICVPATSAIIYNFQISQGGTSALLNTVNFTTSSTYIATDVANYKLWYNTINNFGTATQIGTTLPSSGPGSHAFTGLVASLASSGITYYWITIDLPATATMGNTIAVAAIASGAITVSAGGTFASSGAGGAQTFYTMPAAITSSTGTFFICTGSNITLNDITPGGSYTSSLPAVVTITGGNIANGVANGTATVYYTIGGVCTASAVVTVDNTLPPIAPFIPVSICVDSTVCFTDAIPGGVWNSSSTSIVSINPITGCATGVSAAFGTANITYTYGACSVSTTVTINPLPPAIVGPTSVCADGQNPITLSDATVGGTWSGIGVMPIDIGGGVCVVPGASPGTTGNSVNYTLSTGCAVTTSITVNPLPANIVGSDTICASLIGNLTDPSGGGTWSSEFPTVAIIGSLTGNVTGLSAGTSTITYTNTTTGCYRTLQIYVNSFGPIIDSPTICIGVPFTLTDTSQVPGWIWTISNTTIASVGPTSGIIVATATGVEIVTYTNSAEGCTTTSTITINANPLPITGVTPVCVGSVVTLSDGTPGGTWTTNNTTISIITTGTGVDSGVSSGTSIITYTAPVTNCIATAVVTVDALPGIISGPTAVCVGSTISLSESSTGGTWSASNASATVNPAGVVTGISSGVVIISYTTSCSRTYTITVNPIPAPITGTLTVCALYSTTLNDATVGGNWTSYNAGVATVVPGTGNTGIVTGVAAGTDSIVYSFATSCAVHAILTIDALPAAITGVLSVCVASTTSLSDITTGGTWVSAHPGIASVNPATGLVTGVSAGTDTISYTITYAGGAVSCPAIAVVTVNPLPTAIIGATFNVCYGGVITLSDATAGGSWTSNDLSVATVTGIGSTGLVLGVSPVYAITTITYQLPTGCLVTHTVTVNPLPLPITGHDSVCVGSTITLADATFGGYWSSSANSIATVGGLTGIVTGMSGGVVTISYTSASNCTVTYTVIVDTLPTPIFALTSLQFCSGSSIQLFDNSPGGTWSSDNTLIATVDNTGLVYGAGSLLGVINYTLSTGCSTSITLTINVTPAYISGETNVCLGSVTTLYDPTPGGCWISGSPTIVSGIGPPCTNYGVFVGLTPGIATVAYSISSTGCTATTNIVVNDTPSAIVGSAGTVCVGNFITMTDAYSILPGTWSVTNPDATVGSTTGVVTGVSMGIDTVKYSLAGTGCSTFFPITVNPLTPIYGTMTLCQGGTTTLYDTTLGGGGWISLSPGEATIDAVTGVVTGVVTGNPLPTVVTILFTVSGTGCIAIAYVTVNPLPAPISGGNTVCLGGTTILSDAVTPGSFSSSLPGIASVDAITGTVTGVALGSDIITYTLDGTGCYVTEVITVNPVSPIVGPTDICLFAPTVYTNAIGGGIWTCTPGINLIINATTGAATGTGGGTEVISYTLPTGCVSTITVNIISIAPILPAPSNVCVGNDILFSDATPGGTWSSANFGIASINASTAIATGVASGTVTITYSLLTGCYVITSLVVNLDSPIHGSHNVCLYESIILTNSISGGVWSSADPAIASVSSTGVVTGIGIGTTTIYYVLSTGCIESFSITVTGVADITNSLLTHFVCTGATITLVDTGAGTWSSSVPGIASVTAGGVVTGVTPGAAIITYTAGCIAMYPVTVNPSPDPIISLDSLCAWGGTLTVTDATGGGIWSATLITVTTVDSYTGIVHGVGAGTGIVTFTLPTGCYVTKVITVNPLPLPITGVSSICMGGTTALHDGTIGGTWISGTTIVATVNPVTGVVTGVGAGTSLITYQLGTGCMSTYVVNVSIDSPIHGPSNICFGLESMFYNGLHGGTWNIVPSGLASFVTTSSYGDSIIVTGTATTFPATATVFYTLTGTGCTVSMPVTINPLPAAISYTFNTVCVMDSIAFTDATPGGVWSTTNRAIDTISTPGELHGVGAGVDSILYTLPATGCYVYVQVTVNPLGPILPASDSNICQGIPTTLNDTAQGGVWLLGNANATITDIGGGQSIITGLLLGIDVVTYIMPGTGCFAVLPVTIYPQPNPIMGFADVCVGSTITLTDGTLGGIWSASNADATISAPFIITGTSNIIVSGVSSGAVTITYTMPSGCFVTFVVNVDPLPSPITGPHKVCGTDSITLVDATPFGWWTTSSTLGTINTGTGNFVAYGGTGGVATISYTIAPNNCLVTYLVTVNPLALIEAPSHICEGVPTLFIDTIPTGLWSSSNTTVASVGGGTGVVTGHIPGVAIITYLIPSTGCISYQQVTVNPIPGAITAPAYVCQGQSVTFTDATPGGIWTSHDPTRATIDSFSGILTGHNTGTVIITYSFGTGCFVVRTIIVDPLTPIVPLTASAFCVGAAGVDLVDFTPGGTWTTSNSAVATVTGITISTAPYTAGYVASGTSTAGGVATISYTLPTGCIATYLITVNPNPAPIVGVSSVCLHDSTLMTDATPGGAWSTSPPSVVCSLSAYNYGEILTYAVGTITVVYTNTVTGCFVTKLFTVNPIPDSIVGLFNICVGASTILNDGVTGGQWVSQNPLIANFPSSASGLILGIAPGTTTVSYILPAGCFITHLFEVSPNVTPLIDMFASLGDTTSVFGHDIICNGQIPVFTFATVNEGWTPVYSWSVNSIPAGTGTSFSYSPVLNGDVVTVQLTSNAICVFPTTASDTWIMTVQTVSPASVNVTSSSAGTNDTICQGQFVVFTANPTNGGTAPYYEWQVNGIDVYGGINFNTYGYLPGFLDRISCYMISSVPCAAPDTAYSADTIKVWVRPSLIDSIKIFANPGSTVMNYEPILFTSESVNYGWTPTYQWYVNGVAIAGATNSTFTLNPAIDSDIVYCVMVSSNPCTTAIPDTSNKILVHIANVSVPFVTNAFNDVQLMPNPNKGTFRLKGNLNNAGTEEVAIEITDLVGKVVYTYTTMAQNGKLDMEISLDDNIITGVYYIRLTSGNESDVRHFVIEK